MKRLRVRVRVVLRRIAVALLLALGFAAALAANRIGRTEEGIVFAIGGAVSRYQVAPFTAKPCAVECGR